MSNSVLSMDALRKLPDPPRLHPNGFLTLDIDEATKLHLWPEDVPRRRTDGAFVHDHVFAFSSRVLAGGLLDVRYDLRQDRLGQMRLHEVPCKKARCHTARVGPRLAEGRYTLVERSRRTVVAGEVYDFPVETLHTSDAMVLTATLLRITDFGTAEYARIVGPSMRLDDFDRTLRKDELSWAWHEIERLSTLIP